MTLKNRVPNSTLAGSSMKKVISCGANVRNRMVQQIVKASATPPVNLIVFSMRSNFRAP